MARPTRVIAKHVVAMDAISAPWLAICATSTIEAFTLTAPPRTALAETLRELQTEKCKKNHTHRQYATTRHAQHTTRDDDDDEIKSTRVPTFALAPSHLITGAATTALDAERRAALRIRNTPASVTHACTHSRARARVIPSPNRTHPAPRTRARSRRRCFEPLYPLEIGLHHHSRPVRALHPRPARAHRAIRAHINIPIPCARVRAHRDVARASTPARAHATAIATAPTSASSFASWRRALRVIRARTRIERDVPVALGRTHHRGGDARDRGSGGDGVHGVRGRWSGDRDLERWRSGCKSTSRVMCMGKQYGCALGPWRSGRGLRRIARRRRRCGRG